jgi:hypothetical protein
VFFFLSARNARNACAVLPGALGILPADTRIVNRFYARFLECYLRA